MPQVQQLRTIAPQLTGELSRRDPLGDPADDQDQFDGSPLEPVEGRAREGVKHSVAMTTPEIQDRGASSAVDPHEVAPMAAWAGEPVGVQPRDELGVTRLLVHQLGDREVHSCLGAGTSERTCPEYRSAESGRQLPSHHLAYMSQLAIKLN